MAEITAAAVTALRKQTGLPLMDCKKALTETGGDTDAAVKWLRERGAQILGTRSDRETAFGRFGLYTSLDPGVGAMVELKCESAPVAQNEEFIQLADDLARQLALGPGADTADKLLDQPSPSRPTMTLREQKDELFNRIREVFKVGRFQRFDGPTGGYSHNAATVSGVLIEVEGGDEVTAKDVCMHIAAMRPAALNKEDLDPTEVEKERQILREAALKEGKPANIVDKMVEGRLRNYYAQHALTEQPFVKDDKVTVGQLAQQNGMKIKRFLLWELGKE
jgi:elongation factor Ts